MHELQLSVKLFVCGYYGAFQTLRKAIRTCNECESNEGYNDEDQYGVSELENSKKLQKSSSVKQGHLVQFIACDFLIHKKNTYKY